MATSIPAAGTLPWRRTADGGIEVLLVHRPKYRDWSWAKGKLDPGELAAAAAHRETFEETGLRVRLGTPLPGSRYPLLDAAGQATTKDVRYWAGTVTGGKGTLEHEIDEVAWLDPKAAHSRLDYARDREQLLALVRAERDGRLDTWPFLIVRHALAVTRHDWNGVEPKRPLSSAGRRQVPAITALLEAYGVTRVITSPSTRCGQTVRPYAARPGVRLKERKGLTEERFADDPGRAVTVVGKVLAKGKATALCSHGPVLPTLQEVMAGRTHEQVELPRGTVGPLGKAIQARLDKGEVLVMHMVGHGRDAAAVAVERHPVASD